MLARSSIRRLATSRASLRPSIQFQPRTRALIAPNLRQTRRQSTTSTSTSQQSQAAGGGALAGGVIGGSLVMVAFYAWYHFSGAKTTLSAANAAMSSFESAKKSFVQATPEPNEALQWLRSTAVSYAALLPGGKQAVNGAFDQADKLHEKHGEKIDKIVSKAYDDLKGVVEKGNMDADTARRFWSVLERSLEELGQVAKDAGEDILEQNPGLKEKLGGGVNTLKKYADNYGPEARKAVDDTWKQVSEVVQGGLSKDNIDKAKKIIDQKVGEIKKAGENAWKKGYDSVKPVLDKNPEVKKVVEENKDALLKESTNAEELFEKVKKAAGSGDTKELEKYVKNTLGQAKEKGGKGLQGILDQIPMGGDIGEKFQQLQELAQSKGGEAEKLASDTFKEIKEVLERKLKEGQKLADETKDEGKKQATK